MAQLPVSDQQSICASFQLSESMALRGFGAATSPDLLTAVQAADAWLDTNVAGLVATVSGQMPASVQSGCTDTQRKSLIMQVLALRLERGL